MKKNGNNSLAGPISRAKAEPYATGFKADPEP